MSPVGPTPVVRSGVPTRRLRVPLLSVSVCHLSGSLGDRNASGRVELLTVCRSGVGRRTTVRGSLGGGPVVRGSDTGSPECTF